MSKRKVQKAAASTGSGQAAVDKPQYDFSETIPSLSQRYPGSIKFKEHFTLKDYKEWKRIVSPYLQKMAARIQEAGHKDLNGATKDASVLAYAEQIAGKHAVSDGESMPAIIFAWQWAYVLAFAEEIDLENLPPDCLTDESGESTPEVIAMRYIPVVMEWLRIHKDPFG